MCIWCALWLSVYIELKYRESASDEDTPQQSTAGSATSQPPASQPQRQHFQLLQRLLTRIRANSDDRQSRSRRRFSGADFRRRFLDCLSSLLHDDSESDEKTSNPQKAKRRTSVKRKWSIEELNSIGKAFNSFRLNGTQPGYLSCRQA